MIKTLLLVTDFSSASDHAAERAVQLAALHGATLRLAHLAGSGPPDVAERLPRCAAMLARRHRLPVEVAGSLDERALREAASAPATLLVLGWPGPQARRLGLRRPLAQRLLVSLACPLLVVRGAAMRPAARPYARLLVALGDAPAPAVELLRSAAAFAPEAWLELFHAVDLRGEARLQAADASPRNALSFRLALDEHARQHLQRVATAAGTSSERVGCTRARGAPVAQIARQQDYGGVDLVVVGQTGRPRWRAWLMGSMATVLLPRVSRDLLVWPQAAPSRQLRECVDADDYSRAPR